MSEEAIQPVSATIANAAASKGLRLERNYDEDTGIQSEQEGLDVSSQLQAWRQVHAHLIRAVTTAREAIAAKKCQRRFWMEEICGNLGEDGMLLPTSVWNRPGKDAASKSSTTRKRKGNSGAASSAKKRKTDEDEEEVEEDTGKIKSAPKSTDRKRQKLKIRLAIHNSDASDDEEDDDDEKSEDSDEDQGEDTEATTKEEIDEETNEEHATSHVPTKKLRLDEAQEAHEEEDEDDDVSDEEVVKTTRIEINEHHEGEESGDVHYGTTSPASRHDRGPHTHYGYAPRSQHEYHQEYHGPNRSSRRWSGPPPHPYMVRTSSGVRKLHAGILKAFLP